MNNQHLSVSERVASLPSQEVSRNNSLLQPTEAADEASQVRRSLAKCPYVGLRNISCSNINGALVLHGRVVSFYLKQHAQEIVRKVNRRTPISNQLIVGPPRHVQTLDMEMLTPHQER